MNGRAPALVIRLPLEGNARIVVDARSYEDELRLRCWLCRSGLLDDLADALHGLLDALDEDDEGRAA